MAMIIGPENNILKLDLQLGTYLFSELSRRNYSLRPGA
jgi:hypothetical protein